MAIGIPGGDRQVVVPRVVPTTDPTFTSGLNYARSIAGGENVPNMIAPGVSYSAARPQGYTQMDLPPIVSGLPNIVTDSPPDDPAFLPGGGAVNPPDYTNLPPNIIGGGRGDNISILDDMRFPPPQDFLRGYKPFDFGGIQNILDSFKGDIGGPVLDKSLIVDRGVIQKPLIRGLENPDFVNDAQNLQVPNGRDFSIENIREDLRLPDFENFVMKDSIPTYDDSEIRDLIAKNTTGINSIPAFNPNDYRDDFLSIAREGIDVPKYEMPDVSQFITKDDLPIFQEPNLDDLYKRLDALENQPMIPNGSDFSISRPQLGLFG